MPRKSLVSLLPPFHECLMDRLHLSPKVICRPQSSSLSLLSHSTLTFTEPKHQLVKAARVKMTLKALFSEES